MDDQKDMQKETAKEAALETIINSAVKLPLVKVSRNEFLTIEFADYPDKLEKIIASGPVQAGIPREMLSKHANKLILARTSQSSVASFAAGIPGGFAMAATIPADVMQFFGMSLRLAQELAYLYGAEDISGNGSFESDDVKNRLILYCGVMFGVSGANIGSAGTVIADRKGHAQETAAKSSHKNILVSDHQTGLQSYRRQDNKIHICNGCIKGCPGDRRNYFRRT